MGWKYGVDSLWITYRRFASVEDASTALFWLRELIPVGTRPIKAFADEAYEPPGSKASASVMYRRDVFVFYLRFSYAGLDEALSEDGRPPVANPALAIARHFLAASDKVLTSERLSK